MIVDLRRYLAWRHVFFSVAGLILVGALYMQATALLADSPAAIAGVRTSDKVVAVTFDHSWGNKFTPAILDTLKQYNVKATFFIMGPWAEKYPDVARRIVQDGHEVGSHGYRHQNYGEMSETWITEDIAKAHGQIKGVTGIEPALLRPPNGHYSARSLQVTAAAGYQTIIWNIDSLDWKNPGRDVIVERVAKRLKPGAIILLHASDTPQQTAEALPALLDKIKGQGYETVTVGELLSKHAQQGIVRH